MALFDDLEAWRQIPPEVKLELMARAHSKGLMVAVGTVLAASTCAVALKVVWLMWAALLFSPIIFQLSASTAWRGLKPSIILRYLAARSAARRYAYTAKSQELNLELIFPAIIEPIIDHDNPMSVLNASMSDMSTKEVWITLFTDCLVVMSEDHGGAKLDIAHILDHKINISSVSADGKDYSNEKELTISILKEGLTNFGEEDMTYNYKVTSKYPAALVVFEKKMIELKDEYAKEQQKQNALLAPVDDEDDLFMSS